MSDNLDTIEESAEAASPSVKKKCFWKKCSSRDGVEKPFSVGLLILFACVITIALIGYFTSKAALSVHMVETRLAEWSDIVKESAARKGYDASLTYGAVSIEGGLFSKRAVIATPKLSLSLKGKEIKYISTGKIELLPDSSAMSKIRLLMPAPIRVFSGQEVYRYEASSPVEVRVTMEGEGQAYDAAFPAKVQVFKEGSAGASDIPYATLETMQGGRVNGLVVAGAEEYSQHITLNKTSYKTADRTLTMDSFDLLAEAAKEDSAHLTNYNVQIGKLYTSGIFSVLSPLDVTIDFDRISPSVLTTAANQASNVHKEMSYYVQSLVVKSGEAVLNLSGKFDLIPDEILPLGSAEINITSANALLAQLHAKGVLDNRSEEITRSLLKKVATEWTQGEKDNLKLIVEREYGGGFFIGDTTFEELLALALKEYLLDVRPSDDKGAEDLVGTEIQAGDEAAGKGEDKHAVPVPSKEKAGVKTEVTEPKEHVQPVEQEKSSLHIDEEATAIESEPVHGESTSAMESLDSEGVQGTVDSAASTGTTPETKEESVGDSLKKIFDNAVQ